MIVQAGPEICVGRDGVHMTETGSRALAHAVAQAVGKLIAMRRASPGRRQALGKVERDK